jgi:hypothetical protein
MPVLATGKQASIPIDVSYEQSVKFMKLPRKIRGNRGGTANQSNWFFFGYGHK